MIQLKFNNSSTNFDNQLERLDTYTNHLKHIRSQSSYDHAESSLNLSGDLGLLEQVEAVAQNKIGPDLKYSVVVGIGGSNLGTKAIYDAILGYRDLLEPKRFPKMLFAETTDPDQLTYLASLLNTLSSPDEILITIISKSGTTTETMANFEIIMEALIAKFGEHEANNRVVVISDDSSQLTQHASVKHITTLTIPAPVGGRYSVLSAVGLIPLLSVGLNVKKLRQGAQDLLNYCFDQENLAAKSAFVLADRQAHGYHINDNFFFHPELESLGKWYRQLIGESVGKEKNKDGKTVHTGITPTVSLGSTDLHSVGQLYLGGPKDKITTFVSAHHSEPIAVPNQRLLPDLVPMITGKTAGKIMTAILDGVKLAYQKANLPFMEITLDAIDEHSIGAFLQLKMLEMMYLGELLNVNSFDQPNVESYKTETKRLLQA